MNDPYNLRRFVDAQDPVYARVCTELRDGRKTSHWMWFIFPQLRGLGQSQMAQTFGISSRAEAEAYLKHPVLGRGSRMHAAGESGARAIDRGDLRVSGRFEIQVVDDFVRQRPAEDRLFKMRSRNILAARATPAPSSYWLLLDVFLGARAGRPRRRRCCRASPWLRLRRRWWSRWPVHRDTSVPCYPNRRRSRG